MRIHTGATADTLNRSLSARAFTTGSDIFFRSGQYRPGSPAGQRLIAHELTHTLQQGASAAGPVSRKMSGSGVVQRAGGDIGMDIVNNAADVTSFLGDLTGNVGSIVGGQELTRPIPTRDFLLPKWAVGDSSDTGSGAGIANGITGSLTSIFATFKSSIASWKARRERMLLEPREKGNVKWRAARAQERTEGANAVSAAYGTLNGALSIVTNAMSLVGDAISNATGIVGMFAAGFALPLQAFTSIRSIWHAHRIRKRMERLSQGLLDANSNDVNAKNHLKKMEEAEDEARKAVRGAEDAKAAAITALERAQSQMRKETERGGAASPATVAALTSAEESVANADFNCGVMQKALKMNVAAREEAKTATDLIKAELEGEAKRAELGNESPRDLLKYAAKKASRGFVKRIFAAINSSLGLAGGIAATVTTAVLLAGATTATAAAMVTPLGWAIAGAAAVSALGFGLYGLGRWLYKRYKRASELTDDGGNKLSRTQALLTALSPRKASREKVGDSHRKIRADRLYDFAYSSKIKDFDEQTKTRVERDVTAPERKMAREVLTMLFGCNEQDLDHQGSRDKVVDYIAAKLAASK